MGRVPCGLGGDGGLGEHGGGDDDRMKLQLQAMPAPATVNDKPTLRADNVPVILLMELPLRRDVR
jgi:hypothetical protein